MKNKVVALVNKQGTVSFLDGSWGLFSYTNELIVSPENIPVIRYLLGFLKQKDPRAAYKHREVEVSLVVRKVSEAVGFGVFANQRIPKGTFLGNYVGEVIPYDAVGNNNYLFGMVPEVEDFHSGLVVDAHKYGNHTRFINHSSRPNVKAYTIELDRRAETYFEALRDIESGEQLLFDYGPDYWVGKLSPEAA